MRFDRIYSDATRSQEVRPRNGANTSQRVEVKWYATIMCHLYPALWENFKMILALFCIME